MELILQKTEKQKNLLMQIKLGIQKQENRQLAS